MDLQLFRSQLSNLLFKKVIFLPVFPHTVPQLPLKSSSSDKAAPEQAAAGKAKSADTELPCKTQLLSSQVLPSPKPLWLYIARENSS